MLSILFSNFSGVNSCECFSFGVFGRSVDFILEVMGGVVTGYICALMQVSAVYG